MKGYNDTMPVGSFPEGASPYGLLDMAGNVNEWVNDTYDEEYYSNSPYENPQGPATENFQVVRGGFFNSLGFSQMSAYRMGPGGANSSVIIGFRCARTP
jgi:formylglycine-generating enzyme required for sulfatase activity